MAVLAGDIITGAEELANLVDADFISSATKLRWLNQSLSALFKKIVVWNPDFFLSHVDFTTDGTTNNPFTPPADFGVARGVTKDPTQQRTRRSLRSYNFSARDQQGRLAYRVDGGLVYLESAVPTAANLRLWYDAKPVKLGLAPIPDVTVRAASAADLSVANPSQVWYPDQVDANVISLSGGGGAGGALLVDGVSIGLGGVSGDKILIRHGAAQVAPQLTVAVVSVGPLPSDLVPIIGAPGIPPASSLQFSGPHAVLVIDGHTVVASSDTPPGDVILVAGQVDPVQNGLYRCTVNHPLGGIHLQRVEETFIGAASGLAPDYNAAMSANAARIAVTDGGVYGGVTFRLTSTVGVDVAPLTFAAGVTPGKGLWLCGGRGESGRLFFTRMDEALDAAIIPKGFLVKSTEGTANASLLFSSTGDFDAIGDWKVGTSDVSFDLFSETDVLPTLYEPFQEWLEVRTAIRCLGKEENVPKDLADRLAELTQEANDYVDALNSGDGIAVTDVETDDEAPWGWPWDQ